MGPGWTRKLARLRFKKGEERKRKEKKTAGARAGRGCTVGVSNGSVTAVQKMSCLKRVESEETLDISGPIQEGGQQAQAEESGFALVMRNWGERGITAKQLNVKKGDIIKVIERYPIGLW